MTYFHPGWRSTLAGYGGNSNLVLDFFDHFARLRKSTGRLLREDGVSVDDDVEDIRAASEQIALDTEPTAELGRQTSGSKPEASGRAVSDLDFHHAVPSRASQRPRSDRYGFSLSEYPIGLYPSGRQSRRADHKKSPSRTSLDRVAS